MYILFIVTSFWAYGELTIACEFAKGLKDKNIHPYFLVPPTHKDIMAKSGFCYTTMLPRNGKINRLLMQDIEMRYKPQLVILADFLNYNFCEQHYGLKPEDLSIFSGKLGTFDDFDWAVTGKYMDTYGFKSKKFADIDIRRYGFSLCPCPVVNPNGRERQQTYHYKLAIHEIPYSEEQKDKYKQKLGLDPNRKLIVFTSATWQESYKQYPDIISFVEFNNGLFYWMLNELAKDYTILCVGEEGFFSKSENPNIMFRKHMLPEVFKEYLLATDLFMARNIVSTSLARAVLSGIPSISIQNSYLSVPDDLKNRIRNLQDDKHGLVDKMDSLKRCYKYRMYPVGWHVFLEPICADNPYLETFLKLEQFEFDKSIESIRELLENSSLRDGMRDKVCNYNKQLDQLMSAEEIVNQIIDGRNH